MITHLLDISTAHVSEATSKWIDYELAANEEYGRGPATLIIYRKGEYGWFVFTEQEEIPENVPDDLRKAIEYAKSKDCTWIIFDRDGETIEDLENFDW